MVLEVFSHETNMSGNDDILLEKRTEKGKLRCKSGPFDGKYERRNYFVSALFILALINGIFYIYNIYN